MAHIIVLWLGVMALLDPSGWLIGNFIGKKLRTRGSNDPELWDKKVTAIISDLRGKKAGNLRKEYVDYLHKGGIAKKTVKRNPNGVDPEELPLEAFEIQENVLDELKKSRNREDFEKIAESRIHPNKLAINYLVKFGRIESRGTPEEAGPAEEQSNIISEVGDIRRVKKKKVHKKKEAEKLVKDPRIRNELISSVLDTFGHRLTDADSEKELEDIRLEAVELWLGAEIPQHIPQSLLEVLFSHAQQVVLGTDAGGRPYNYVGSGTDLWKNVREGVPPSNELDKAAMIHDLRYLAIGAQPEEKWPELIREADIALKERAENLADSNAVEAPDAAKVAGAMAHKLAGDYAGILPHFVKAVKPIEGGAIDARLGGLHKKLHHLIASDPDASAIPSISNLAGITARHEHKHRKVSQASEGEEEEEEKKDEEKRQAAAKKAASASKAAAAKVPAAAAVAAPRPESIVSRHDIGIQGAVDVVKRAADFNQPDPDSIYIGIHPVTGERLLSPSLVRGDNDPKIAALTPKERAMNEKWYSQWMWVPEGEGNGNQQPLPYQIYQPPMNTLIDHRNYAMAMQYRGALFDGGVTVPVRMVPGHQMLKALRQPMFDDHPRHQRMFRNGPEPAQLGRKIVFSSDREVEFQTPKQKINSLGQRLFRPNIVDGRRQ